MSHLSEEQVEAAATGTPFDHLHDCASCKARVRAARGRRQLLGVLSSPAPLSEVAVRRVEARVMAAVAEPEWPWWARLGPIGLVAVGAALAVWLWPAAAQRASGPSLLANADVKASWPALMVVDSVDASVRPTAQTTWAPIGPGSVVAPGSALAGTLTLSATDAALPHLKVSGNSRLGEGDLQLAAGTVTIAMTSGAISAGPHRIEALGAECLVAVQRVASQTVVQVTSGAVDVASVSERRRLTAPSALRLNDNGSVVSEPPSSVSKPSVPAGPWAWLDVSNLLGPVAIDGDATSVSPWPRLVTVGRHRVSLRRDGRLEEHWFEASAGLQPLRVSQDQAPVTGDFASLAHRALQAQVGTLRACYESWLKTTPTAAGQVVLTLSLASSGAVSAVDVRGPALPSSVSACLKRTARRLALPAPGRHETLDVPLVLQPAP